MEVDAMNWDAIYKILESWYQDQKGDAISVSRGGIGWLMLYKAVILEC